MSFKTVAVIAAGIAGYMLFAPLPIFQQPKPEQVQLTPQQWESVKVNPHRGY